MHLSIYLSVCLSVCLSVYPSNYLIISDIACLRMPQSEVCEVGNKLPGTGSWTRKWVVMSSAW